MCHLSSFVAHKNSNDFDVMQKVLTSWFAKSKFAKEKVKFNRQ